jgi:hypothetical protein
MGFGGAVGSLQEARMIADSLLADARRMTSVRDAWKRATSTAGSCTSGIEACGRRRGRPDRRGGRRPPGASPFAPGCCVVAGLACPEPCRRGWEPPC